MLITEIGELKKESSRYLLAIPKMILGLLLSILMLWYLGFVNYLITVVGFYMLYKGWKDYKASR